MLASPAVFNNWAKVLQFGPRDLEVTLGALVVKSVQTHVLHQNIQAVHKRAGRSIPVARRGAAFLVGGENTPLLTLPSHGKRNAKG